MMDKAEKIVARTGIFSTDVSFQPTFLFNRRFFSTDVSFQPTFLCSDEFLALKRKMFN
jgi:hypothetical protein